MNIEKLLENSKKPKKRRKQLEDFMQGVEAFEESFKVFLDGAKPGDDLDWLSFVDGFRLRVSESALSEEAILEAKRRFNTGKIKHWQIVCKQYPQELAGYLKWVFDHSDNIRSYFEIGPERGGTYMSVCTLLKTVHGEDNIITGSLDAVPKDQVTLYSLFRDFAHNYKGCSKKWQYSRSVLKDSKWDLIFVDGGHTYDCVSNDYNKSVKQCRYLGFHDIHLETYKGGVPRLWKEVKDNHKSVIEIVNTDPLYKKLKVGIGILEV